MIDEATRVLKNINPNSISIADKIAYADALVNLARLTPEEETKPEARPFRDVVGG